MREHEASSAEGRVVDVRSYGDASSVASVSGRSERGGKGITGGAPASYRRAVDGKRLGNGSASVSASAVTPAEFQV